MEAKGPVMEAMGPVMEADDDTLPRLGPIAVDAGGICPAATFSSSRAHASSRASACSAASATGAAASARWICSLVDSRARASTSGESGASSSVSS